MSRRAGTHALMVGLAIAFATAAIGSEAYAQQRAKDPEPKLAIEMRFGPYHPDVDQGVPGLVPNEASGIGHDGPYHHIFGDDRRFMVGLEVDWQALHVPHFGSVGIGGSISYTASSGAAKFKNGPNAGTDSVENSTLTLWPFTALAVVRVDMLARDFGIPIIPYGKAGIGVAYWSATNGRGVATSQAEDFTKQPHDGGTLGRGHTNGFVYAVGAQLLLDFLDRQAAKTFAAEQGVLHTHLFLEYTVTQFHGLLQTGSMWVGDKTWNLGFMFEL